ncbi:hypothetical protein HGH93_21715 [Chitinophaga polysaccharea]|uniref:hypothetical protein n=1 Tax=Chitinophaga polysaccharea TaxID=1293035 RepID=UPI001454FE97|nr:hypothetical protein [Chitinophaga polysaccharea]NLR60743.1 hypothetical protein [Chitinophaga polysaccharea]
MNTEWIETDSSQGQYCRKISAYVYEYKDNSTDPVVINTEDYNKAELESLISPYGYTLDGSGDYNINIFEEYNEEAYMIIAECIFETKFSKLFKTL